MIIEFRASRWTVSSTMHRTKISKYETAELGTNIRRLRQKLKLSQGQFAAELGVRQQKVSEWERGERLRAVIVAWRLADFLARHSASVAFRHESNLHRFILDPLGQ